VNAIPKPPIHKILIANRGEIACRIIASCHKMGIQTVAVYSAVDREALHVQKASMAIDIGASEPRASYLNQEVLIAAARKSGAEAIHPGYGFLSENAEFARACTEVGIVFIGPSAAAIEAMGSKSAAKEIMQKAGVPLLPGYNGQDQSADTLLREAQGIGFPILIKASAGGGGRGIRIVREASAFADALASCKRESLASFGNDHVLIERYLPSARHIEVQVFGDHHGNVVHLFERDCSMQRRHQKVIEEAPAPRLTPDQRESLGQTAVRAAQAIGYTGAGTVEFIAHALPDGQVSDCYFMEMNTRLQVEHPVTEMITGLDLVEWQIRVARGEPLPLMQSQVQSHGHAIEVRICAEDPERDFMPATGLFTQYELADTVPGKVRFDSGLQPGDRVSPYYDSMVAKLICWGEDRAAAIAQTRQALADTRLKGPATNLRFLSRLLGLTAFADARLHTGLIEVEKASLTEQTSVSEEVLLLAVAACLKTGPWAGGTRGAGTSPAADPWTHGPAWRHVQPAQRNVLFRGGGSEWPVSVQLHPLAVAFSEAMTPFSLLPQDGPEQIAVQWNNRVVRGYASWLSGDGHRVRVWTDQADVIFDWVDPFAEISGADTKEASLAAPMPGQISRVPVQAGSIVKKGDTLVVISAMKMEFLVTAPRDGTVAEVLCTEGDLITEGAVLARLDPPAQEVKSSDF
jgi:3-methylcrotonyl-CoA carboxylase alpha subunit